MIIDFPVNISPGTLPQAYSPGANRSFANTPVSSPAVLTKLFLRQFALTTIRAIANPNCVAMIVSEISGVNRQSEFVCCKQMIKSGNR